ncbi:urease subunit beta [Haloquadratum walsbyi]|jgi:urease, beta subunit|uniref:Urease subunit beta n=1 Tax=Haloquadratum walsbyi J07HQW2 TaxID=1238425 RepID=U1NB23_9EURY|nr:urease subunit beta [Haloquadratum walsbyi]ERG94060.1 MAG: urease, beta subunit [Haloquadratum walsbyi J07HQW2]
MDKSQTPGEIIPDDGEILINQGHNTEKISVQNTGDRPIQIGSHFHFFEVNEYLKFDREEAFGMRLNIPAGTAVRFEPGEEKEVELVEIGGKRRITGLNNLTNGSLNSESVKKAAIRRAENQGYQDTDSD